MFVKVVWYLRETLDPTSASTRKSLKDFSRANFRLGSINENEHEDQEVSNKLKRVEDTSSYFQPSRTASYNLANEDRPSGDEDCERTKKLRRHSSHCTGHHRGEDDDERGTWTLSKWSDCDPSHCFNWNTCESSRAVKKTMNLYICIALPLAKYYIKKYP